MKKETGLTLIELLVSLAVFAIITAIAIPAFNHWVREQRLTTAANLFLASLHFSRSEAISRNTRVTLCPSSNGEYCEANLAYTKQWIAVVGPAMDQPLQQAGPVLRVFNGTGPVITGNGQMANYISFVPTGETRQLNHALLMGTIELCLDDSARRIVINRTGRARVERTHC